MLSFFPYLILFSKVLCDQIPFDCPMRQLALEFAQEIQPWLTKDQLQQIADALNGAQEANNCSVSPSSLKQIMQNSQNPTWGDLDGIYYDDNYIFVDYNHGKDINDGSINYPLKYLETAILKMRAKRKKGLAIRLKPNQLMILKKKC